jgi:spermidine/putrescine transport system permease protein
MTVPTDAVSTSPSRGGLTNINMYVLEVIEAAILGLVFGLGAFWFEFISPDQIVNIGFGFVLGYVVLLFLAQLWRLSQVARIALTWLSLGFIFFLLILLDLNRDYLLARLTPEALEAPRTSQLTREWLTNMSWLGFIFLYLPILLLIIFSFNDASVTSGGRVVGSSTWKGFTLDWYGVLAQNERIIDTAYNTIVVAIISTILATIIGTMVALAMDRYNFFGKPAFDGVLYMPIIIPDIVMALSLILFFVFIGLSTWTQGIAIQLEASTALPEFVADFLIRLTRVTPIIIAHVAFNIAFVAVVVRARLNNFDRTLEEAAQDLFANEWQTFRRITLPLIMPGIIGGALLAFTLSLDDFVITFFVSGPGATTLPVRVYSMIRLGVTPEINAISAVMLFVSILLLFISLLVQRR